MMQTPFSDPYLIVRNIRKFALSEIVEQPLKAVEVFSEAEWEKMKDEIQAIFSKLSREVEGRWPAISSRTGATAAKSFRLVFRTFYPPSESDLDPVVVSVTMEPEDSGFVLWGDIVGEETGAMIYEIAGGRQHFPRAVTSASLPAVKVASELAEKAELIAGALGVLAQNIESVVVRS